MEQEKLNSNSNSNDSNNQTQQSSTIQNKSNSNGNEEFDLDITTACWFYQDSSGVRQGPFSFKEMYLWWKSGYFPEDLLVKTVWEEDFSPLGTISYFTNLPLKIAELIEKEQEELSNTIQVEPSSTEQQTTQNSSVTSSSSDNSNEGELYSNLGGFNLGGKFQVDAINKAQIVDRDQRMMSYYFDNEKYQAQMNAQKNSEDLSKKKKQIKGSKKFWKERKERKKKAKLIASFLAD